MNTKDIITAADNFLVKNDVRELPLSMTTLESIAKKRKWVLLSYSSKAAQDFIADLGLEEAAKRHKAFSAQVQSQHIIFYDDNVSYNDKIHCICHEIGHIVLHHTTECQMVGYSSDVDVDEEQEAEANAFAAEMMAPVCILVKARIKSVSDLIGSGYISAEQALRHFPNIKSNEPQTPLDKVLCQQLLKSNNPQVSTLVVCCILIIGVIICSVLLLTSKPTPTSDKAVISQTTPSDIISKTVYITHYGEKYHKSDCYHINNAIEISMAQAQEMGYEPCKDCY